MAKKKKEPALNYNAEIKKLKEAGPARLYFLWGEEEYLRDSFLRTLRELCGVAEEDGFQVQVFKEPQPDPTALRYAIDTLPFFSERSLIEVRDVDWNKPGDSDRLIEVLSDIPDYCTVAFRLNEGEEPNGKSKLVKFLRTNGTEIHFTVQDQNMLFRWIARRFAACGKGIEMEAAQRLIWLSGDQMKALIPEIEKIAAFARSDKVTVSDVNAVANRIPESDIFDLTDAIAERRFNTATGILADLLDQRETSIPAILSLLSGQFRRLLISTEAENSAEEFSDSFRNRYEKGLILSKNDRIMRSVRIKVDHNLLVKPGTGVEDIREIYSHSQALTQCASFLQKFPNAKIIPCENTAVASRMVAESEDPGVAALSSRACAKLYGLEMLMTAVQDSDDNYTRFICISKNLEIYPGADHTSLMMVLEDEPGCLYKVLSRF